MSSFATVEKTIEQKIKAEALRLGFSLCGITSAESPDHFEIYENWLSHGDHASMQYLATDRHILNRKEPSRLLPSAKTILSLGWSYSIRNEGLLKQSNAGWIAGYAVGKDYHTWLPDKLRSLVSFIQQELTISIKYQVFTDSAPILEREIANRAGLGWIGRNSCLISPKIGSAFLLAEVFLDYPLVVDEPLLKDYCGTCKKCIEACPTNCIQSNHTIDSRNCLSYQTIENRDPIPLEMRTKFGNWLFGCDICQMVCPWNNRPKTSSSVINFSFDEVLDLLLITPQEFVLRFGDSSVSRAKWKGLIRNALVLVGNSRNLNAKDQVIKFLNQNTDEDLLEVAHWTLKQVQ